MELDGKGLGRLRRVADPREVWETEAGDFTPWLADNLDVLAEELGLALTLTGTEVPVGDFRLDIAAQTPDGQLVVIENQLGRTDHSHLGQLLVYASGLEAAAVVWVAPRFREEFRRALDWLNERTDTGVDFFGVEVGVVQIGTGGPRAPVFEVVARPNGWQKSVKGAGTGGGAAGAVSALHATYQDFFAEVLAEVVAARPQIEMPTRKRTWWLAYASGPFGYWSIGVIADGRLRLEAYLDTADKTRNKALFDELVVDADGWAAWAGVPLSWERMDHLRASSIATDHDPVDLADPSARVEARAWAVRAALGMFDALNPTLRTRAQQLREAASSQPEGGSPAAVEPAAPPVATSGPARAQPVEVDLTDQTGGPPSGKGEAG